MPAKIYKWQKCNKNNNKYNFTKDVTRPGAYGISAGGGERIWSYAFENKCESESKFTQRIFFPKPPMPWTRQ